VGASQIEAELVLEQKLKYWLKTLSEDAIDMNTWRAFDTFDWATFWSDWVLSDTLFSSLVSMLLFDIPPSEIVPWTLVWGVELPTPDEFLRGVLIKLEQIDVTEVFPELKTFLDAAWSIFEDWAAEGIAGMRLEKAVYGKSRYDRSYYDPEAVREFLRSTLYAFAKKDRSWPEIRLRVQKAAEQLGIPEDIARMVFDRVSEIEAVKEKAATWDYAWWDVSSWSPEVGGGAVEYTTYDLTMDAVEYEQMFDAQAGGVWDRSCWDYCYWAVDEPVYRYDPEKEKAVFDTYRDYIVSAFRHRYMATALAAANYQTAEERARPGGGRVESYALPASQRVRIEALVERIVKGAEPDVDAVRLRLYKSAALEIYGALYSPHRWGAEMQKAMGPEELKRFWVSKWSGDGLNPDTLSKLWDAVKPVIDAFGSARTTARMRFLREKLRASR